MVKQRSFYSERTAEYLLVKRLTRLLDPHFRLVVPVYFWITREGNRLGRRAFSGRKVVLLTVFARRAKVRSPDDTAVRLTVNESLLRTASVARSCGLPVFAGLPLAVSLDGLVESSACGWYSLVPAHNCSDFEDLEIDLDLSGRELNRSRSAPEVIGPLAEEAILDSCLSTPSTPWPEACDSLSEVRRVGSSGSYHPYAARYKPFHMVLA